MGFWKEFMTPECVEKFRDSVSRNYWPFTGDLFEIRLLCREFPAADEQYFKAVATGGFAIHEGALRFFSVCDDPAARNVIAWNAPGLWKEAYGALLDEPVWCFAGDVFGNQFCFKGAGVFWFNAETAEFTELASSFAGWKERIAGDLDFFTGAQVAAEWHESLGRRMPLTADCILMPIRPFRCDGAFEAANLYPTPAADGMRFRGKAALRFNAEPDCAEFLEVYRREEEHLLSILRQRHLLLQGGSCTGRRNLAEYIIRSLEIKHRIYRLPPGIRSQEEYLTAIFENFPLLSNDGDDNYNAVIDIHLNWTEYQERSCLIYWEEIDSLPEEVLFPVLNEYLNRLHHLTRSGKPDQFRLLATSSRPLEYFLDRAELQGTRPEEDRDLAAAYLGFVECDE